MRLVRKTCPRLSRPFCPYTHAPLQPASQVVEELLEILTSPAEGRGYLTLSPGDQVAVLVNNLGCTTMMEMAVVLRSTLRRLKEHYCVQVLRVFSGTYVSSLDMAGVSVSVFKLTPALLARLDAPADPWTAGAKLSHEMSVKAPTLPACAAVNALPSAPKGQPAQLTPEMQGALKRAIASSCSSVVELEPQLTLWDSKVGDGDCGETIKSGGLAVLADLQHYPLSHVVPTVQAIGCSLGKVCAHAHGRSECVDAHSDLNGRFQVSIPSLERRCSVRLGDLLGSSANPPPTPTHCPAHPQRLYARR